jgi:hypothetical protein
MSAAVKEWHAKDLLIKSCLLVLCSVAVIICLSLLEAILPANERLTHVALGIAFVCLVSCPALILSMGIYSFVGRDKLRRTITTGVLTFIISITMAAIACFVLLMAMVKANIFVD